MIGQALKCGTNHCPTGIATQDPKLMSGLHVPSKKERVQRFQDKTVHAAAEIISAAGVSDPAGIAPKESASTGILFCLCSFPRGLAVSSFWRGARMFPLARYAAPSACFHGPTYPLFSGHANKRNLFLSFSSAAFCTQPPPTASSRKELSRSMIKLRTDGVNSASYADLFPPCKPGSLLEGTAPDSIQAVWRAGQKKLASS